MVQLLRAGIVWVDLFRCEVTSRKVAPVVILSHQATGAGLEAARSITAPSRSVLDVIELNRN